MGVLASNATFLAAQPADTEVSVGVGLDSNQTRPRVS